MNAKYHWIILFLGLVSFYPAQQMVAQSGRSAEDPSKHKLWSAGLQAGPYLFIGDLPFTGGEKAGITWAYGGFVEKQFLPWLSVRGQALSGKLSGQGSYFDSVQNTQVDAYFRAKVFEYNLGLVIHFAGLKGNHRTSAKWQHTKLRPCYRQPHCRKRERRRKRHWRKNTACRGAGWNRR